MIWVLKHVIAGGALLLWFTWGELSDEQKDLAIELSELAPYVFAGVSATWVLLGIWRAVLAVKKAKH